MGDGSVRFGWRRYREEPQETPAESGEVINEGEKVELRSHVPANRAAFQRWYADVEIARLLRHDQRPLNEIQSRGYFDTIILPGSAAGLVYAIHERSTGRLIGTTAITDIETAHGRTTAFFRIVIGEKDLWDKGYGTEATLLVMDESFRRHGLDDVKLEVFRHNPRAIHAYERVGFTQTGEHAEFVGRERWRLDVVEMQISRESYEARYGRIDGGEPDDVYGDMEATSSDSDDDAVWADAEDDADNEHVRDADDA